VCIDLVALPALLGGVSRVSNLPVRPRSQTRDEDELSDGDDAVTTLSKVVHDSIGADDDSSKRRNIHWRSGQLGASRVRVFVFQVMMMPEAMRPQPSRQLLGECTEEQNSLCLLVNCRRMGR